MAPLSSILPFLLLPICGTTFAFNVEKWHSPSQALLSPIFENNGERIALPSLSNLSEDEKEFATFTHTSFPNYSLRIKKAPKNWCDPSVNKYTGYLDISPAKHVFFYFFESRSNPDEDPVVLWTNGGPGASSTLALFFELGPCNIVSTNETETNPHSWNEVSNILFIEQPLGTGFSYLDHGKYPETGDEAANDVADFVSLFFEVFHPFHGRPFHLSGESYAGRLLPLFAAKIYDRNKLVEKQGGTPINLKSVMIGNGYTSNYHMITSYYNASCTPILYEPVLDIATCVKLKTTLPRCERWLKESCYDIFDLISCGAARTFCEGTLDELYISSGMNPYDVSKMCDGKYEETSCYPESKQILDYLNGPSMRELLGVSHKLDNYSMPDVSWDVLWRFLNNLDSMSERTEYYLENLLDRGVDVLIYVGAYDWVCNWVGIENMVKTLRYKESAEFHKQDWRLWHTEAVTTSGVGVAAGRVKNAGGLTFLTIFGAGHMAPHDKPVELLDMFKRWLNKNSF